MSDKSFLTFIDDDRFARHLKNECREGMIAAAEPAIQDAMKEIEKRLRQKVASIVIGMIDADFNLERHGHDLRITVLNREVK